MNKKGMYVGSGSRNRSGKGGFSGCLIIICSSGVFLGLLYAGYMVWWTSVSIQLVK